MKPAYIPDTVIYGVTDKIPNIKFKKSMKKVYVLVFDSVCRGEQEINVKTFGTKTKARAEMKKCYAAELTDWKFTFEDDEFFEVETGKESCSIWEKGEYCQNHVSWTIHEQEVL
jgi:hypothetical protein